MTYEVLLAESANVEIRSAMRWIARRSPRDAERWYDRIIAKMESLENNPERCGLAPEAETTGWEIRQLLFGKRHGIYRILFTIEEEEVRVHHVVHGARQPLNAEDFDL